MRKVDYCTMLSPSPLKTNTSLDSLLTVNPFVGGGEVAGVGAGVGAGAGVGGGADACGGARGGAN
eukprot:907291-Amorphochlora_amoeboformis.AAC.1